MRVRVDDKEVQKSIKDQSSFNTLISIWEAMMNSFDDKVLFQDDNVSYLRW